MGTHVMLIMGPKIMNEAARRARWWELARREQSGPMSPVDVSSPSVPWPLCAVLEGKRGTKQA